LAFSGASKPISKGGIKVLDILLDPGGDLKISEGGDISLTQSVRQAIRLRLKWFLGEWRLGPLIGLDYWGTILVKNPNIVKIRQAIRNEILSVKEVTAVNDVQLVHDKKTRSFTVRFEVVTDDETIRDEVKINA